MGLEPNTLDKALWTNWSLILLNLPIAPKLAET